MPQVIAHTASGQQANGFHGLVFINLVGDEGESTEVPLLPGPATSSTSGAAAPGDGAAAAAASSAKPDQNLAFAPGLDVECGAKAFRVGNMQVGWGLMQGLLQLHL